MPQVPTVRSLMLIPNRMLGGDENVISPSVCIRPGLLGGWAVYNKQFLLGLLPIHTCTTQEQLAQFINRWSAGLEE